MNRLRLLSILISLTCLSNICLGQIKLANTPTINVNGTGTVEVFPNAARISILVRFLKPTLRESLMEGQKTTDKVIQLIKSYNVDSNDTKVSMVSTDKETHWNENVRKDIFDGFSMNQKVIFTL